ncbi:MAG TPA: adenosylcobalamin-dependent ribonucleoside-diphosphate reductase [Candidatus Paceibacterota bacterium]|nr:adenosylcobalamin-dependent ribonucleoside-diphosphate reductase [Candidatus Paceibacterota bacterium]
MTQRFSYNDAFQKSKEYFKGDELAAKVFLDKYALRDSDQELVEDTPEMMIQRIATEFCRIEKNKYKIPMTYEEIYSYLDGFKKIIPQGSVLSGVGNPYQYISISNCFVVDSPVDSYSGICKADEQIVQISKRRGGVGLDISNLRPNGTSTTNAARTSTGIIPFMERFSNSIREVGQSGRRGALLVSLSVHHPEVVEFAESKKDTTKITGANISIRLTDEFLNAVKKGKEYEQRFPVELKEGEEPLFSKKVDAREVWMKIIQNARDTAEPGLLFWDNIIKESPADCYSKFGYKTLSTNPCSELPLSPLDSCRLLVLNLYYYVKNKYTKESYFDFVEFYKDAQVAQRFMDNIVDIEVECIEKIIKKIKKDPESLEIKRTELDLWKGTKETCEKGRRTGTGITALGDTLAALGIKYGTEKSIEVTDKIYKTLKLGCYRGSVKLSKELGAFSCWDHELEKDNPFLLRIKKEDPKLWEDMKKYGRRNISLLTTAPAGSISILARTSSGIEPVYQLIYTRKKKVNLNDQNVRVDEVDKIGDCWQYFDVKHPKLEEWTEITGETDISKSPWAGCCAEDINWKNRVKLQAAANKSVDHSISSTINLPEDVTIETVAEIYETAWKEGVKGITVYRKNSRSGVLVDKKGGLIEKTSAPKRPKLMPCEIFHTSVKGEIYFVLIGLLDNKDPYEIFAGKNGQISRNLRNAIIKKIKRGKYSLCDANDPSNVLHEDISKYISEDQEAITRLVSSNLRHGCDVSFIVHQLEKTQGDLQSFSKAISRVLKKYIEDGSRVHGEECPECGSQLIRQSGCIQCGNCGWSRCQ